MQKLTSQLLVMVVEAVTGVLEVKEILKMIRLHKLWVLIDQALRDQMHLARIIVADEEVQGK